MVSLTTKYQPKRISEFAGLKIPKAMMAKLTSDPWSSAWLFVGAAGTGKTTLGLAVANELNAELHHIPAAGCTLETVRSVAQSCYYMPMCGGNWHVVLIDEGDQMTNAAQLALLSYLDATAFPPNTIFIITCNATGKLEPRFLSRCRSILFDGGADSVQVANFLFGVWVKETGSFSNAPIMRELIAENGGNIRGALMAMEMEILIQEPAEVAA